MKKSLLFMLAVIILALNLCSCVALKKFDEAVQQKIWDEKEKREKKYNYKVDWKRKYILDILYVNMPEAEFLALFTKTSLWTDLKRPYITKYKDYGEKKCYILSGLDSSYDYKVTFKNAKLTKFEYHGHGSEGNPFGYNDATSDIGVGPRN